MQRSELSGKPIDGEAASEVEVLFPDGRRRRLLVQAAEADDLAGKGSPVPSAFGSIRRGAEKFLRAVGKWALLSLVGVLVVQALAKQVSDRQKELELKRSLASDLGSSSFEAFAQARSLVYLPIDEGAGARRHEILTAWISDEGRLDGAFRSYLPSRKHAVGSQWGGFRDGLYAYLRLACCETASENRFLLRDLQAYLRARGATQAVPPKAAERWSTLQSGPNSPGYADAYDWLGRQVLLLAPFRGIEKSEPEGFSIGFWDFAHDAIPGY